MKTEMSVGNIYVCANCVYLCGLTVAMGCQSHELGEMSKSLSGMCNLFTLSTHTHITTSVSLSLSFHTCRLGKYFKHACEGSKRMSVRCIS